MTSQIADQMGRAFVVSLAPIFLIILLLLGVKVWKWFRKRGGY